MEQLLTIASGLTPVLQVVLIVILAVIFWEPIAQKIGWKEEKKEEMPSWAAQLMDYYNHSTTDKLNEIHDEVKEANRTLEEMKTYGISLREKIK